MRIWWPTFAGVAVFLATAVVGFAMSPQNNMEVTDWPVLIVLLIGVPAGVGGLVISALLVRLATKRQIDEFLAEVNLDGGELLAVVSCGYCPNYRGTGPPRGVGGFLALTDRELVFCSGPAEFTRIEKRIPLSEIGSAESCKIGFWPSGLRIPNSAGTDEYFLLPGIGGAPPAQRLAWQINRARLEFPE